jgi:hypothetical protein
MHATSVGRLRQSVLGVNHARSAGRKARSAFMERAKETRNESETSNFLEIVHGTKYVSFREMERLQYQNKRIEQRNDQLVNVLLNFASELSPNERRELEGLVLVRNFTKIGRVCTD